MTSKRDLLIDAALKLSARDGIHATGIDQILAEAGVARMTLYNQFGSKDGLILAALSARDADARAQLRRRVEARATAPRDRLLAIFDELAEAARDGLDDGSFMGCAFINAAGEYAGHSDSPVRKAAAHHKRKLTDYVAELAGAAGARDADALARDLVILYDGATVAAHAGGDAAAPRRARRIAASLIADAVDKQIATNGA